MSIWTNLPHPICLLTLVQITVCVSVHVSVRAEVNVTNFPAHHLI